MKSEPEKDDWKAEDDARTLMIAAEIKQDKKRLAKAMKYVDKQKKAINSIDDLRDKASEMAEEKEED